MDQQRLRRLRAICQHDICMGHCTDTFTYLAVRCTYPSFAVYVYVVPSSTVIIIIHSQEENGRQKCNDQKKGSSSRRLE